MRSRCPNVVMQHACVRELTSPCAWVCVCSDDLTVDIDAGRTELCQNGKLQVSELENTFANVVTNDHSLRLSEGRYRGVGKAVIGTKAFFAGGYHDSIMSDHVDILEMNTRTMTTATLSEGRNEVAGAALRHIAMFFGGFAARTGSPRGSPSNVVDIYNNETNAWSHTTLGGAQQSEARGLGAATGVGDVILFAGGHTLANAEIDEVDIYNIVTEVWTTATLSVGRCCLAAASVGTIALFAGGGTSANKCKINCNENGAHSGVVDLYNSADGTWSTATLSEARSFPASATHGTKAFFGGGDITPMPLESKRVDIYDSATGAWSTTDFPSQEKTLMAAAASGRAVLFYGGVNRQRGSGTVVSTINIYDVATGIWSVDSTSSTSARYLAAGVTVGDSAIFAGGYDSGSTTDLVEIMKFETQIHVYGLVSASSRAGSISGRYQIPMRVAPLSLNISLPTGAIEATDHASGDTWDIHCNATFNGKLHQKFVLGATDPVCIATSGLCPIGKYSTGNGVAYDITNCLICPALTTTSAVGSTLLTLCKCIPGYTGQDTGPCTACAAGTYKDAIGSSECTSCPPATYSSTVGANGAAYCLACPAYTTSRQGSTLLSHCICNAGYTGPDGSICVACIAGKFKSRNGTDQCMLCAPGKFSASTGVVSDVCADCSTNTYSSADKSQCETCPSNTVSAVSSAVQTDCKCIPGYTGPDGGTCVACIAGKFKTRNGTDECTLCAPGKFSASTGVIVSDMCADCSSNTYSSADNSQCETCLSNSVSGVSSGAQTDCKCVPGYVGPDGGTCVACIPGKFKASNGTSACTLCAQGKYLGLSGATLDVCLECARNSTSPDGSDENTDCVCDRGLTGIAHTDSCVACEPGKYKSLAGAAECTLCSAATYSVAGLSVCTQCPTGGTSLEGSTDVADCKCNLGYTGLPGVACAACEAAKYKDVSGTSACLECPLNTSSVAASPALTHCLCLAGHTGNDGSVCAACLQGDFKSSTGSAACSNCAGGSISTQSAQSACSPCPSGTFSAPSRRVCISCPEHTRSNKAVVVEDCKCNTGYTGPDGGACVECSAGKYKVAIGSGVCTLCTAGKYSSSRALVDETSCQPCQDASTSPEGSLSAAECLCDIGYTGPNGGIACAACAVGKFKSSVGSAGCTQCVGGKFLHFEAAWSNVCADCATGTYSSADNSQCVACPSNSNSPLASPSQTHCLCNLGFTGSLFFVSRH